MQVGKTQVLQDALARLKWTKEQLKAAWVKVRTLQATNDRLQRLPAKKQEASTGSETRSAPTQPLEAKDSVSTPEES